MEGADFKTLRNVGFFTTKHFLTKFYQYMEIPGNLWGLMGTKIPNF